MTSNPPTKSVWWPNDKAAAGMRRDQPAPEHLWIRLGDTSCESRQRATQARFARQTPWLSPREERRDRERGDVAAVQPSIEPAESIYKTFYSAGLHLDVADLDPTLTAIGVDLGLAGGRIERGTPGPYTTARDVAVRQVLEDGGVPEPDILGVDPTPPTMAKDRPLWGLGKAIRERDVNLFLDNGAFRLRNTRQLTEDDLTTYLDRAEALVAEMERHQACCTILLVAPDVVGNPAATMALRANRKIMARYFALVLRCASLMWPIHGRDPVLVGEQLDQLRDYMERYGISTDSIAIGVPSSARALDPETIRHIAVKTATLTPGWARRPIRWFHLLGTSRQRFEMREGLPSYTVGHLAEPIADVYRTLSQMPWEEGYKPGIRPIITSDSTRAVTKASKLRREIIAGTARRPEVIGQEARAGLHSSMTSAAGVSEGPFRRPEGWTPDLRWTGSEWVPRGPLPRVGPWPHPAPRAVPRVVPPPPPPTPVAEQLRIFNPTPGRDVGDFHSHSILWDDDGQRWYADVEGFGPAGEPLRAEWAKYRDRTQETADKRNAVLRAYQGGVREFTDARGESVAVIVPDAGQGGFWRYSAANADGFFTHRTTPDELTAVAAAADDGYVTPAAGTLDAWARAERWADGTRRTAVVQIGNALRSQGMYEAAWAAENRFTEGGSTAQAHAEVLAAVTELRAGRRPEGWEWPKRSNPGRAAYAEARGSFDQGAAEAFMAEYEAMTVEDLLGSPERYWPMEQLPDGHWCLVLTNIRIWDNTVWLSSIHSPDEDCQRRGFASQVMGRLTALADKHGVTLGGAIKPFSHETLDFDDLLAWYRRAGFGLVWPEGDRIYRPPGPVRNPAGGGTALDRRVPAPARAIAAVEDVSKALDLGAGRTRWGPTPWDPHHADNDAALARKYPVVTSIYVLNVMPTRKEWDDHLALARRVLRPGGRFYASVRTDDACDGDWRKQTTRGWQVCRDPDAWRDLLDEVFTDVRRFDSGSGYVTFVGER